MLAGRYSRILAATALVVMIFTTGYIREHVFLNINYQLWHLWHPDDVSGVQEGFTFLTNFGRTQLYWGKWGTTVIFSLIFLLLSCTVIKLLFKDLKYVRITVYSFGVIIAVAAIFYLCGVALGDINTGYSFSRIFMGIVQSPLVLMVLIPAFKLLDGSGIENKDQVNLP